MHRMTMSYVPCIGMDWFLDDVNHCQPPHEKQGINHANAKLLNIDTSTAKKCEDGHSS